MTIALRFLGAARTVTGSRHLIEADGVRILVDCGLYQERDLAERNWDDFPVPPASIHAVVLTHAHLDHCGLLPRMVRQGFAGRIITSILSAAIAPLILFDSAHLQMEDAEHKRRRHLAEGRTPSRPIVPLYDEDDAQAAVARLDPCAFGQVVTVAPGITATFHEAGHIPGAASVLFDVQAGGARRRILFSGDVGRDHRPILNDPDAPAAADVVLVESTYGDRVHGPGEDIPGQLAAVVNEAVKHGGKILVPSFAIGRAQEVIWHLDQLIRAQRIPPIPVLLDSPMAIKLVEVLKRHPDALDAQMRGAVARGESPFTMPTLKLLASREDSKTANTLAGPAVIIAGAGMCTGGRIKHHLDQHIESAANTVLFVGYQAGGTLGRLIVDGVKQVRLFNRMRQVRARVAQIHGFSGHADRDELLAWLKRLPAAPQRVFVIHGGANVAQGFAALIHERLGFDAYAPQFDETIAIG